MIILTIRLYKISGSTLLNKTRWLPLALVFVQVALGIAAVLLSLKIIPNQWGAFEWMAQLHQLVAMFLLLSLVWILYIVRNKRYSH
jgi:cytochrome c oxidase assembly protein subunit 15